MRGYLVYKNGEQYGPYSIVEIEQRLHSGDILPTDFIWADGMGTWRSVSEIVSEEQRQAIALFKETLEKISDENVKSGEAIEKIGAQLIGQIIGIFIVFIIIFFVVFKILL